MRLSVHISMFSFRGSKMLLSITLYSGGHHLRCRHHVVFKTCLQSGLKQMKPQHTTSQFCPYRLLSERNFSTSHSLFQFKFGKQSPLPRWVANTISKVIICCCSGRPRPKTSRERNLTTLLYLISAAVGTTGAAYAAVPLYRAFCQSTSYGGTIKEVNSLTKWEQFKLCTSSNTAYMSVYPTGSRHREGGVNGEVRGSLVNHQIQRRYRGSDEVILTG